MNSFPKQIVDGFQLREPCQVCFVHIQVRLCVPLRISTVVDLNKFICVIRVNKIELGAFVHLKRCFARSLFEAVVQNFFQVDHEVTQKLLVSFLKLCVISISVVFDQEDTFNRRFRHVKLLGLEMSLL